MGAPAREVRTERGRYALTGTILPGGLIGTDRSALVSVAFTEARPALPSPEAVRTRHGLTKREAEVALLLTEGLTNEALADRLFVSVHTARHHVEAVLLKLGVNTRAAVAAALFQPG
jgi:DNA-binding CsgD family transcriptional regulator